jgi:hypothetical protein
MLSQDRTRTRRSGKEFKAKCTVRFLPHHERIQLHSKCLNTMYLSDGVRERLQPAHPLFTMTPQCWNPLAVWDLGVAEPLWTNIREGSATESAIVIADDSSTQVWGSISPGSGDKPLCKWVSNSNNGGNGDCRTDVSWLHAAVGLKKAFFSDPLANYILRFHMQGACYRSSQVHPSRVHACGLIMSVHEILIGNKHRLLMKTLQSSSVLVSPASAHILAFIGLTIA